MFADLLEQIPAFPRNVLEGEISVITYGDLAMGNGRYENGRISISPAIRHPRLFIERTMHECGHGIEEWLGQNGYDLYSCNLEQVADGFGLSLLYPDILIEPGLKKIRKIYKEIEHERGSIIGKKIEACLGADRAYNDKNNSVINMVPI